MPDALTNAAPGGELRLDHNRRVILDLLRRSAQAGRAELARASGLSTQAVSNIIADLEDQGLVQAEGRRRTRRGQPPLQFSVRPSGACALGVEVRPDRLRGVLVDLGGRLVASGSRALPSSKPASVLPVLSELVATLRDGAGPVARRTLGCGVVVPGPFGVEGLSAAGRTVLQGWEGFDMAGRLSAALELPVWMDKDANAAALGERLSGVARGLDSFCYLYFGVGIGLAVVAHGAILRGSFGNAGEVGHVICVPDGLPCECGNRGCLEQYASRMALARDLAAAGIVAGDVEAIGALHAAGNAALSDWQVQAAAALGQAVGMLENLYDPQVVILGGALPDALIDALIGRMALPAGSVARRADRALPRVLRGALGAQSAAIGGAALVLHDTMIPKAG